MKPKFSKEFNVEHAKAGAPYGCVDGDRAQIFKWDLRGEAQLGGIQMSPATDFPCLWRADGSRISSYASDLIMLPLGEIAGKPVFVGDELVMDGGKKWIAGPTQRHFDDMAWPAPAKEYPRSQMTDAEILCALDVKDESAEFMDRTAKRVRPAMDSVLRHALDAGQVVPAEQYDRAVRALDRAGFQDLGGEEWVPPVGPAPKFVPVSDPERDMAIAKAVRNACRSQVDAGNVAILETTAYGRISGLDLAAIIAGIAP